MNAAIVVVGTFVKDLSFRCGRFPAPGETVLGTFSTCPGGKGFNQAVAAARSGARTRFVGAVGADPEGKDALRFLRRESIEPRLAVLGAYATATAAVLVDHRGMNQIVVAAGAGAALRPRDVPASRIQGSQVVVCQGETNPAVNLHAFRLARRFGATTILNPAPWGPGFDRRMLALTDILIPNEVEFAALAGRRATGGPRLHALCRTLGVPTVIVTLGRRGCFLSAPGGWTAIAGHAVRAVDTTGAGDAFVGSFAAGLVRFKGNVRAAAHFGNAAAAVSVTRLGTSPSMPRLRDIDRFLRSRSGARSS